MRQYEIDLEEIDFSNDSIFADPIESLVLDGSLVELVDWIYDYSFRKWDVEPTFSKEEMIQKLKTEWLNAGGIL